MPRFGEIAIGLGWWLGLGSCYRVGLVPRFGEVACLGLGKLQ